MKRRFLLPAVLVLLTIGVPICSHADWSSSPARNTPVVTTPGNQYYPRIVADGSGGAVTVWRDDTGDLHAQRLNANGKRLWSAEGVFIDSYNGVQSYEVASDGNGGAVVAWHEINSSGESDIYAQRVNGNGEVMWGTWGKAVCTAASEQYYLAAAGDGSGGIIVVWQDLRNTTRDIGLWDIYAQRISAGGDEVWQPNGIPVGSSARPQLNPRVLSDGLGGAIVVWEGVHDDAEGYTHDDIRAQKINAAGDLIWGSAGKLISSSRSGWYSEEPQIVSDGNGGAIFAWRLYEGSATRAIYAQRVDSSGAVIWPGPALITGSDFFTYDSLRIVSDGTSGAIATWIDYRNTSLRLYGQRLDSNGNTLWAPSGTPVTPLRSWYLNSLSLIADGNGGAIVTWDDDRNGAFDVFMQKLSPDGAILWAMNGVTVSTAQDAQALPKLASDGSGGAIVTWMDRRNYSSNDDIYAQRILANGVFPAVLTVTKSGPGKGDVHTDPGLLDWSGKTGAGTYAKGDSVTVTAVPQTNYAFGGWAGACMTMGFNPLCDVSMTAAKKVTAAFNPLLKVTTYGVGAGIVRSSASGVEGDGIECGFGLGNCSESYSAKETITLTAEPGANAKFVGWSGACTGVSLQCTVNMDYPRGVRALFSMN